MTAAAGKRPFSAEDVYRLRQITDPRLSPDGTKVAYVVQTVDREADEYSSHIYQATIGGGEAQQLTRGAQRDSSPRWSPDGRRLAFVSNRGNREKKQGQIFLIEGLGEAWQLTDAVKGAGSPVWSPDGKTVLFQTKTREAGETKRNDDKTPIEKNAPRVIRDIIYRFDGEGQFDDTRGHLWTIPADGGAARQITAGDWSDGSAAWSPDGKSIAFTSHREADRGERRLGDVWVVPAGGGEPRRLTENRGPSALPAWSPDGQTIAYEGHTRRDDAAATTLVWTVPAEGGTARPLNQALDRSAMGMPAGNGLAWLPDGSAVLYLAQDAGASRLYRVPVEGGASRALTDIDRYVTAFDLSADGSTVVFSAMAATSPGELYLLSLADGTVQQLTHHNDVLLAEVELAQHEPLSFEGVDGWQIPGWILKPAGYQAGQRVPLVLSIHGGPHGMHGPSFFPGFQTWAGRGYAVLLINPRGSNGYGERFTEACVGDWGGKDYDDLMRGVDWAIAQGIADPERLVVTGYSYGGFMTSWVVGHTNRFKAAVCGAPVSDLVSFYGESDIGTWFGAAEQSGPLWERWDAYRERSPLYHIQNCRTPFLLVHWEGDLRCPVSQSEELFGVLKKLGREVEFVRYPGGFHGVSTPSQLVDRFQRSGDWFERFLDARPASAK
ncbi:MAG: alpha/beta hydrolase family protein [Dehalococcoidia bacterium]